MSKSTKYFTLFSALKAGGDKGVSPTALQKATGFNQGALAVYIHALRHDFGAKIESVRSGRTVTAYRLTNAAALESVILPTRKPRVSTAVKKTPVRKGIVSVTKIVKAAPIANDGSIPIPDADLDITEYTDSDLADIRQSLGI
jgi:hypothetical protein